MAASGLPAPPKKVPKSSPESPWAILERLRDASRAPRARPRSDQRGLKSSRGVQKSFREVKKPPSGCPRPFKMRAFQLCCSIIAGCRSSPHRSAPEVRPCHVRIVSLRASGLQLASAGVAKRKQLIPSTGERRKKNEEREAAWREPREAQQEFVRFEASAVAPHAHHHRALEAASLVSGVPSGRD